MNETLNGPVTETELVAFLAELNRLRKAAYSVTFPTSIGNELSPLSYDRNEVIRAEVGPKYIRLVTTQVEPTHSSAKLVNGRYVRGAYAFLDRSNGNILKTAGFKTPAKGVRGNIRQPYWDSALNCYGAAYLR